MNTIQTDFEKKEFHQAVFSEIKKKMKKKGLNADILFCKGPSEK